MTTRVPQQLPLPNRRATKILAQALARHLQGGDVVILNGELGAGKTFLVRALCRALMLPESIAVTSPTFPLIRELPTHPPIVHADLYRLETLEEAYDLGFEEFREQGCVLLVEWGDRFALSLGRDTLRLTIDVDPRQAQLAAEGPRSLQLMNLVGDTFRERTATSHTPDSSEEN